MHTVSSKSVNVHKKMSLSHPIPRSLSKLGLYFLRFYPLIIYIQWNALTLFFFCNICSFFPASLRYIWHITLYYKFQVYNLIHIYCKVIITIPLANTCIRSHNYHFFFFFFFWVRMLKQEIESLKIKCVLHRRINKYTTINKE